MNGKVETSEIRVMIAPNELIENAEIILPNYLIEHIEGEDKFYIHRELDENESNSFNESQVFEYIEKKYVSSIAIVPTREAAEKVINSMWRAISQLPTSTLETMEIPEKEKVAREITYRVGYDYLFLPQKSFEYKGERIGAMSVNVLFQVFDKDGNEVLFHSNEGEETDQGITLRNGETCRVNHLLSCYFDKETILKFIPYIPVVENFEGSFKYVIDSYSKALDNGGLEPIEILEEEFMDIMNHHLDLFDSTDNYPGQSVSYFIKEVTC